MEEENTKQQQKSDHRFQKALGIRILWNERNVPISDSWGQKPE